LKGLGDLVQSSLIQFLYYHQVYKS
jgi:hypothetical protein